MKIEAIQAVSSRSVLSDAYADLIARVVADRASKRSPLGDLIPGATAGPPGSPPIAAPSGSFVQSPTPGLAEPVAAATPVSLAAMSGAQVLHALEALSACHLPDRTAADLAASDGAANSLQPTGRTA